MKKNILSIVAIVVLALSFTSCKKKDEATGTGYVRFINASELSSPLDLYISDIKKNNSPVAYTENSSYFDVAAKQQDALIKVAASGLTVFGFQVQPQPGTYYSLFYISQGAAIAMEDNNTMPAAGKARVRFINLNLGATTANDFGIEGGTNLVTNLQLRDNSSYYDVPPNTKFNAYATGSSTVLVPIPTTIEAGHIYTIYLSGHDLASIKANVLLQK